MVFLFSLLFCVRGSPKSVYSFGGLPLRGILFYLGVGNTLLGSQGKFTSWVEEDLRKISRNLANRHRAPAFFCTMVPGQP